MFGKKPLYPPGSHAIYIHPQSEKKELVLVRGAFRTGLLNFLDSGRWEQETYYDLAPVLFVPTHDKDIPTVPRYVGLIACVPERSLEPLEVLAQE